MTAGGFREALVKLCSALQALRPTKAMQTSVHRDGFLLAVQTLPALEEKGNLFHPSNQSTPWDGSSTHIRR